MKKQAGLLLMALVLSFQAHSADFKPAKKLKNSNLEALSNDISEIISDKKLEAVIAVNDIINEVSSFSFTRKPTEIDLNTVKQFNIKFLDIYPESDGMGVPATEITTTNATDVVNAVFGVYYFGDFSDEDQVVLKKND